jgi:hypothetical protein
MVTILKSGTDLHQATASGVVPFQLFQIADTQV